MGSVRNGGRGGLSLLPEMARYGHLARMNKLQDTHHHLLVSLNKIPSSSKVSGFLHRPHQDVRQGVGTRTKPREGGVRAEPESHLSPAAQGKEDRTATPPGGHPASSRAALSVEQTGIAYPLLEKKKKSHLSWNPKPRLASLLVPREPVSSGVGGQLHWPIGL